MKEMANPWENLPTADPYVLEIDHARVKDFNRTTKSQHMLRLELLPEPFLGNPNAPIVLLNLNPGFSSEDEKWHKKERFKNSILWNLAHREAAYPFYLLDRAYSGSPGHQWWRKRLNLLIAEFGLARIASNVFCVELFPYHSESFSVACLGVESQAYGFELVRRAISRRATIVFMRSKKLWISSVPELEDYAAYELENPRSPYITPANSPAGYEAIRSKLLG
jgi:hypothetical protein